LCHGLPPPPADYFPKVIEQHGEAALRASRCRALRKRVNDAKQLTEPRNGANEALITKRVEKLTDRASRTPETGRLFADHRRHEPGSEVDRVKDELIRVLGLDVVGSELLGSTRRESAPTIVRARCRCWRAG
jgi:hypothetical protein